jgi:predicted O-linked N-acetylglucosamine transferase (SPINDLY family)
MEISTLLEKAHKNELTLADLFTEAEKFLKQSDNEAVLSLYETWIEGSIDPFRHIAMFNYASLLQTMGRIDTAEQKYYECIAIAPKFAQSYINLGLILERKSLKLEGLGVWSKLLTLAQDKKAGISDEMQILALNHIGRVQEDLKKYDLAELSLQKSLSINPKQPAVLQHLIHIRQKACSWPIYKKIDGVSSNELLMATSPLAMLALTDDPVQLLLTSHAFIHRTYEMKEEYLCQSKKYLHRKKRIGYVSGDFCVHAVGILLAELLEGHDRDKYEIYGYDFSPEDGTEHRVRLKKAFDTLRHTRHLTDKQIAEIILSDEIDILIDLHGLSAGARPGIFSYHPAPKQGTYLGFMGTTALPWFDFVITDKNAFTEKLRPYFTETPLFLERSFIPLVLDDSEDGGLSRQSLGLPEDGFVMAAFGNAYKITPELFEVWMKILQQCSSAVLWLIDESSSTTVNLQTQIQRHGIDLKRVIFTPRTNYAAYKKRLKLADVFLDTYPYNCGSTTVNVIQAGVPMVTMYGRSMVSRMGLSIMDQIGLQEFCVNSFEDYQDKVLKIAESSKEQLDYLRGLVKSDIKSPSIAKAIERALETLEGT